MREVHILHNLFNHVRLRKIDIYVGEGINVDAYGVFEVSLIFNIKLGSNLCDILVDCCVGWEEKNAIVHVDNENGVASIEHKVVQPELSKSYFFLSIGEGLIPHSSYFPLPIYNFEYIEDMCCPASTLCFDTLGNIHVDVELDVIMIKSQYKAHLACTQSID